MLTIPPASPPQPRFPPPLFEVVARRVNRPPHTIDVALAALPTVDGLERSGPFRLRDPWPAPTWRATGRLLLGGHGFVHHADVVVDVEAWTDETCELRVRPSTRRLAAWSGRRQRRYFTAAHELADELLRLLAVTPPLTLRAVA